MSMNNEYRPPYHSDINETFIIEALGDSAVFTAITACTEVVTNLVVSCSGDSKIQLSSGETVFNTSITPVTDSTIDIGTPIKRFRNINTISGSSSFWVSTVNISTPNLDLGLDLGGNSRVITANNSIIQDDTLLGGNF